MDADVIVVGAGLAGLVAAAELAEAGRRVIVLDQEGAANLGGQAYWSFGGLFLVDSPSSAGWASATRTSWRWQDWLGSAGFDRPEDHWPRQWAQAYVDFAAGEKRSWLHEQGDAVLPGGRLGRARRRQRERARQLRAALPHHLGHRARRARALRAPRTRLRSPPAGSSCASATASTGSWSSRRRRSAACAEPCSLPSTRARGRPTSREVVGDFELQRPGGGRHLRWHRRQPRAGARQLARPASAPPPER